ncbi:peptidoglycan editing factor PgeF [Acinetobacter larvae]|uniref:Purine nucleoside phosphorylase n=1 Tax=Acinetobacter larvae TaxID=1789224 RepID=A0A1B2LXT6_9GAMM|nr:peptidoglycan editing factor PgeF [Acinetobacter larvae]AOA57782.1 hypothetical protein BFG52_05050 [Acinetobacter larvae]
MQLIQNLAPSVLVAQTEIVHAATLATAQTALQGFNLALHVNDENSRVQQHRMALLEQLTPYGVQQLTWLNQTHSTQCHRVEEQVRMLPLAGDALVTQQRGHALMIMTADCLAIALGDAAGQEVAVLHAGWRGLANGMIENTVASMQYPATWAWMGAAISQAHFEVGAEVREQFCSRYPALSEAFIAAAQAGKYYADLYAMAGYILQQLGIQQITGGEQCSYAQAKQFYSYRRNPLSGRMATLVFRQ